VVCIGSLQFYTTFWSLSMYDLHVPTTAYDKQIQLHKSQIAMEDDKDMVCDDQLLFDRVSTGQGKTRKSLGI